MFTSLPSPSETEAIIVFFCFALGYTIYHFLFHSERIRVWFHRRHDSVRAEILRNCLYRAVQVLGLGVVPMVLLATILGKRPADYGLLVQWDWGRAGVIAALCALVVGVIVINPGKEKLTGAYPQMRISEWSAAHIVTNTLTWAVYLLAYELMFRGFMLFALLPYGVWVAVSVNIALYVLAHVPKGLSEAIGAIPFGMLVCGLTLTYGTIWAAFWLHLALALANSYVALSMSSEMRLCRSR